MIHISDFISMFTAVHIVYPSIYICWICTQKKTS